MNRKLTVLNKPLILTMVLILMLNAAGCSIFKLGDKEESSSEESSESEVEENSEYPVNVFNVTMDSRPGIVVSLSPSLTAKVVELGLERRLEGISDDCEEPEGANMARCGSVQLPNFDELESLSPHLIISETPLAEKTLIALQEIGADAVVIPRASNISQLKENYVAIAKLFEGDRTGGALGEKFFADKFQKRLDEIKEKALAEPKNAVFIKELDFTVATGDTLESALMEIIGLNNIAKDYTEWKYPEEEAHSADGIVNFNSIDFIFCDKSSVTMKMMEGSAFYKRLNAVLKDYYLYIDQNIFDQQCLPILDELERMAGYINGDIQSSKSEESSTAPAQSETPASSSQAPPVSQAPSQPQKPASQAPPPASSSSQASSSETEPPPEEGDFEEPPPEEGDEDIDPGDWEEDPDPDYDPDADPDYDPDETELDE